MKWILCVGQHFNVLFTQINSNLKRVEVSERGDIMYIGNVIRVRISVTAVNDKPKVKRNRGNLVPLPYDLNATAYTGSVVKDILAELAEDVDDENMDFGAAVISLGNSSFGKWQYKMNDSLAYTDFNFSSDSEVLLLPPEARYIKKSHHELSFFVLMILVALRDFGVV